MLGPNASAGEPESWSGSTTACENITLGPTFHVGNPVALLIQCNALVVLAVAQVNWLRFASCSNLDELTVHLLANPTAKVDCQILHLVLATVEDDPTRMHNWCWSMHMDAICEGVDGQYIHSLNPVISIPAPGKLTFLFEGSFLVTLSCSLFQVLRPQDYQWLPLVRGSDFLPYRFEGMTGPHVVHSYYIVTCFTRDGMFCVQQMAN